PHRHPPSFPTRRSSDLAGPESDGKWRRRREPRRGAAATIAHAGAVHTLHRRPRSPPDGVSPAGTRLHEGNRATDLAVAQLHRRIDRKSTRLNSSHRTIS